MTDERLDGPVGTYLPCRTCAAPVVEPFPPEWTIDLIKEGPRWGPVKSYYIPHSEQCDAPMPDYSGDTGICVRVSGHYVVGVYLSPPPAPVVLPQVGRQQHVPSDLGYLFTAPLDGPDWTGWVPLGTTVNGFSAADYGSDQEVHWLNGLWPVSLNLTNGDVTE